MAVPRRQSFRPNQTMISRQLHMIRLRSRLAKLMRLRWICRPLSLLCIVVLIALAFPWLFEEKALRLWAVPGRIESNGLESAVQRAKRLNDRIEQNWTIILPNATKSPYDAFAPHLDVIWSRGWYNARLPPLSVPLQYYNRQGNNPGTSSKLKDEKLRQKYWDPDVLCKRQSTDDGDIYLWLRSADMSSFYQHLKKWADKFSASSCNFSIINSDGDDDVSGTFHIENSPIGTKGRIPDVFRDLLTSTAIYKWYAQNLMEDHPKLVPIPIGLELHSGLLQEDNFISGILSSVRSPLDVIRAMRKVRNKHSNNFVNRTRGILVDLGSVTWCQRRIKIRTALKQTCSECGIEPMPFWRSRARVWEEYASYQFAVAPTGCAWDTHRLWELLFFGTIPIVLSTPSSRVWLKQLLISTHVPVLVVHNWTEICELKNNATLYDNTVERYKDWIRNSHHWLRPKVWIPHNRERMKLLCENSPGCVESFNMSHRLFDTEHLRDET